MAKPLRGRWVLNLWDQQWGEAYRLRLDMVRRTHIECLLVILLTEVVNNTKDFGNFVFSKSSFGFGRERPERPKAPSPGQAKRHPGYRVLEQLRPVRAKALPLTDRVLKIGINHCYCCPMRISKARLMLLPFQGATALTRKPPGVASLALGYVHHWAFSPSLLNPKLQ